MYRDKNNKIEDSFKAYLVEGAEFTDDEEYPIIPPSMVSKALPEKIVPFDKAINSKEDLSHTFISFYSRDETFERVRRIPSNYVSFFQRTAGILGLDFSIHTDMPIIRQKEQMNDNLSLTYYYGSKGCKVIPNIRLGVNELKVEFYNAIPKNELVAIGTHGFYKCNYQKAVWICAIKDIIDNLHPTGIIVVGPLDDDIIKLFSSECKFYIYKSWLDEHRRENYDKRTK